MTRSTTLVLLAMVLGGCDAPEYSVIDLVGGNGSLRFNLVFTHPDAVDLDLHVITPRGDEIYYAQKEDPSGGELDVDCFCGSCDSGPNENIFWEFQTVADSGDYEVSVVYYGSCAPATDTAASEYTLRILEAGTVVTTYTGELRGLNTDTYTHTYAPVAE